jgi:Ca-activated chloride channel family protein
MIPRKPVSQATHCVSANLSAFGYLISAVLFCAALTPPGAAQAAQQPDDDEVLRVSTDLVVFPARIRDRKGQRPNGLKESDLRLKDPDHATRALYLTAGVDRVAMIFALDESGSLRDIINEQRDAALQLYERFGSRSSIAVLHFAETPQVAAGFARDSAAARSAFEVLVRSNHHTAIFDAAAKTVDLFATLPRIRSERRIVILISDGLDNLSKVKPDKVIETARDKSVSFYVIHLPLFEPRDGRLVVRPPAAGFRGLAEKTGGKYFLATDSPLTPRGKIDLAPIFQAIEDDLRSQYLIGFYVDEKAHDGKAHKLSLSLPEGLEYQVGDRGYENTHKFSVH